MKARYHITGLAHARVSVIGQPNGETYALLMSIATARHARRMGYGTKLLEEICADADKAKLPVRLYACPDDPKFYQRLVRWYQRHGFTETREPGRMIREPQGATE